MLVDPPAAVVRERNRARGTPVPSKVVTAQLREIAEMGDRLADEGFAAVRRKLAALREHGVSAAGGGDRM